MIITKIHIKNYRSIKEIEIYPNKWLNAFIWENSVGKSNIFSAINWILWKTYPTFNQVVINDHFWWKLENTIFIQIDFDDGMSFVLDETQDYSFTIFKNWARVNSKNELREKYAIAYLDTSREIVDYLPSNKWSLVWRILQQVNDKFANEEMIHPKSLTSIKKKDYLAECLDFIKEKVLFTVNDDAGDNIMQKFTSILQNETAEQLNRSKEEFTVDFNLYDPWNFYKTLQILVKEDNGLTFQASQLWMWVQASISIAILKAYAELNLKNKPAIFIDEPELFLHPQAQRNFYNILRELSEDKTDPVSWEVFEWVQIFYNTHSPDFLNAWKFNEIFLVRKNVDLWTYVSFWNPWKFCEDLNIRTWRTSTSEDFMLYMQNAYNETGDSQKANEGFFAKKIILVEWQTECWALPYLFEISGFNYIKEWITIVRCWCKNEIDRFYRLYSEFWIPCYVVFDGDIHLAGGSEEAQNIKENQVLLEFFGNTSDYPDNSVNDKYLWFEKRIEENLNITIGSNKKSLEVFRLLKSSILTPSDCPSWIAEMIEKLKNLKQEDVKSVLKLTRPTE